MDAPGPYGSLGHTDEEIGPEGKGEFPGLHSELVTEAGLRSGCPGPWCTQHILWASGGWAGGWAGAVTGNFLEKVTLYWVSEDGSELT